LKSEIAASNQFGKELLICIEGKQIHIGGWCCGTQSDAIPKTTDPDFIGIQWRKENSFRMPEWIGGYLVKNRSDYPDIGAIP
jgi:hypothetical protein